MLHCTLDLAAALDFGAPMLCRCLESLFSTHIPPCLSFAGTLISPWLGRLEKLSSSKNHRAKAVRATELIFLLLE